VLHRQQTAGELLDGGQACKQPTPTRTPSERDQQAHAHTLGPRPHGDEAVERLRHDSERTPPLRSHIRQTVTVTSFDPSMTSTVPAATAEEAAAIAAAIERFTHDTTPPPTDGGEVLEPWTRAAMLEGVVREDHADVPHPWINT
jgi:hypothetical protein